MMNENYDNDFDQDMIDTVESLNEEVRTLAINLAIYLAKIKGNSSELTKMEPAFIRLVNGTVKVVQELTLIINAAKNMEKMIYEVPSGKMENDNIGTKLNSILEQCNQIITSIKKETDITI